MKHLNETGLLLALMRAALHQDWQAQLPWPAGCSAQKLEDLILRQSLVSMIYPVLKNQKGVAWAPLQQSMKRPYEKMIQLGVMQEYEIQALLDSFEQEGIDCMPIKGWITRTFYPDPLMRSMADLDVVIRQMDSGRMRTWMKARDYVYDDTEKGFHDGYWKLPFMYVELHQCATDRRSLPADEAAWVEQKEQGLWDPENLLPGKKHIYRMGMEDFYVHSLLHFRKHFTGSGVGIRFLADIYVFRQQRLPLDAARIRSQLEAVHMTAFARQMERVANACFDGTGTPALDRDAALVVDYLVSAGAHGNREVQRALQVQQRGQGTYLHNMPREVLRQCFPSAEVLHKRYPRLEKAPWLLPAYWAVRAVRIVAQERYKIGQARRSSSKKAYDQLREVYLAAGVLEK